MPPRMTRRPVSVIGQRGAALLLLLMLVSVGALAVFVSGLNRATVQLERDRITNEALAQAKAALIGRAVSDDNSPGSLPCPDTNNDGVSELLSGNSCPVYVGRLPWKTLRLPDLRDGKGERLWYALSANFRDDDSAVINSDTLGILTLTGSLSATQAIAVIFAPGAVLPGQARDAASENMAANYLEGTNATSFTEFVAGNATPAFNDRLMPILHSDLLPLIEKRIAREAKKCLDDYALISGGKYPWAANLNGLAIPEYSGDSNIGFGRFPQAPNVSTSATPQSCTNAQDELDNPPCSTPHGMHRPQCQAALAIVQACSGGANDPAMSATWPSDCANNFMNKYWENWKELIFYQVSPGYQPGSSASCPTCLTLNATGGYRAMIIVAGKKLSGQERAGYAGFSDVIANYLEEGNADGNYAFDSKLTTATFNDQVACVDGQITCK